MDSLVSPKYTVTDRPNGRRSNGPSMLHKFGPSKWTKVQWTSYITLIWTVQMDVGPMDLPYYVNLDRPNGRPSKWTTVHWTA